MSTLPSLLEPVNRSLAPWLRLGLGSPPACFGGGLVLLEVQGRRTGAQRSVPLLATSVGRHLFVSTARARSQWLKNLRAAGRATVWLRGRREQVVLDRMLEPFADSGWQVAVLRVDAGRG
jgi:deazaflavin-dependent oxidoreductase (nitroreductase family)